MSEIKLASNLTPASAAKRESILCAAAKVFMESGYGAASMDQIAGEAGVSKQTVYSHFGAKHALFEEIVTNKCSELMGADDWLAREDGAIESVLRETAVRFMRLVTSPESITLYRVILAESGRFPELAEAFYRAGPRSASNRLAAYLEKAAQSGKLTVRNPRRSAETFFAMMRDDLYLRCLLSLQDAPDEEELESRAMEAVELFLRAHR